jgi:O-methyltransferase involved in polyketide biosynthesis
MKDAPSETALLVAGSVAFHSTHPRHAHLVPDDAGRLARTFAPSRSGSSPLDRTIVAIRERLTVPGLSLHHVLRKRRIEQMVRAGMESGYRRLVVLGAGLDTLAFRLSGEIACTEIDHPATQRLKRELLGPSRIEFVPRDLATERIEIAEPALFVAEAVFLYLTEEQVRQVLRGLRGRLIFTFWEPRDPINFQNATWIADWWLRHHGEPGRWAIAPDRIRDFVESEDFTLLELARDTDFQEPYRAARGEHIAVAERR